MPHLKIYQFAGARPEGIERVLADAFVETLYQVANVPPDAVSIHFVDVPETEWNGTVLADEILSNWDSLTKEPGYVEKP